MTSAEFFTAGDLKNAIAAALDEVKQKPLAEGLRWRLAELLLLAGDLERADKHLDTLLVQQPKQAPQINQFRSLLRGEQARREIAEQGRVPDFLTEPTPAARSCLAALVALRAGDIAAATRAAAEAEAQRAKRGGTCDGRAFADLRDLDDLSGPLLEFLSGDGNCGWLPLEQIAAIQFGPRTRPRDLAWRQANVTLTDGRELGLFVPALYPGTFRDQSDAVRLGRETQWREIGSGLLTGAGQRMWLIGDDARPLLEINELKFAATA